MQNTSQRATQQQFQDGSLDRYKNRPSDMGDSFRNKDELNSSKKKSDNLQMAINQQYSYTKHQPIQNTLYNQSVGYKLPSQKMV